jgi:hypothetical protein
MDFAHHDYYVVDNTVNAATQRVPASTTPCGDRHRGRTPRNIWPIRSPLGRMAFTGTSPGERERTGNGTVRRARRRANVAAWGEACRSATRSVRGSCGWPQRNVLGSTGTDPERRRLPGMSSTCCRRPRAVTGPRLHPNPCFLRRRLSSCSQRMKVSSGAAVLREDWRAMYRGCRVASTKSKRGMAGGCADTDGGAALPSYSRAGSGTLGLLGRP